MKPAFKQINVDQCWTHNVPSHDFFLNYRVAVDGVRHYLASSVTPLSTSFLSNFPHYLIILFQEPANGIVEVIYNLLATQNKQGGVLTFWDKKCLNYGQHWENGFLHGIDSASIIVLLVSMKVFSVDIYSFFLQY